MSEKQTAIACVNYALGHAVDNLIRASRAFYGCSEEELDSKYGQSDDTPREIIKECQDKIQELEATITWLESK